MSTQRTEWQTRVKTLPCRNYVTDGNKASFLNYERNPQFTLIGNHCVFCHEHKRDQSYSQYKQQFACRCRHSFRVLYD